MAAIPQFGDIVVAIRICYWIYTKCIDPENEAFRMYLDFRKDVVAFEMGLKQLQRVFPAAAAYTESLDDSLEFLDRYTGIEQRPNSLEFEVMELIGNFKATLEECKRLLRRYVKFENGRSTVRDNAFWHLATQQTIESLRARIETHTYSIALIVEPLQLGLITDIHENIFLIVRLLRISLGLDEVARIPPILATLAPKFEDALLRDAPPNLDVTNIRQIPVKETVQVLCIHFKNSTKKSACGVRPEVEQYLNLLKAQWLVNVLNQSHSIERPQSQLHRRIVGQVEQWIAKEYTREDLLPWDQLALEGMDEAAFAIWPKPKLLCIPQPTDKKPGEDHIGTIQLVPSDWAQKQTLDVFRSRDHILRLVLSQTPLAEPHEPIRTILSLNTRHDTFIPRYTVLDSNTRKSWCIQTIGGHGTDQHIFDICSKEDAYKLQSAFTNYTVSASKRNVECVVTCRKQKLLGYFQDADQDFGDGEVQLWQWSTQKPLQEDLRAMQTLNRPSDASADRTSYSQQSLASIASIFHGLDRSVVSVTEADGEGVAVSSTSPPPFLVAFVKKDRIEKKSRSSKSRVQYIMWKIDVSDLACHMRSDPLRITLKCKGGKNFNIQKLSTSEHELDAWNLCALVDRSHAARTSPKIPQPEVLECNYIVLTFKTKEEREQFALQFKCVTGRRAVENCHAVHGERIARANEVNRLQDLDRNFGSISRQPSAASTLVPTSNAEPQNENPTFIPPQHFDSQPITLTPPQSPNLGER